MSPSGWNKASLSLDASEEHDGYSSAEDPLNSDAEDDNGKMLVSQTCQPVCACISHSVGTTICLHSQIMGTDSHSGRVYVRHVVAMITVKVNMSSQV